VTIRDLVAAYVLDDMVVAGLLGTRLYPNMLPQKVTYPAGVIQAIDIVRPNALRSVATLARARVQMDVYCDPNTAASLGSSGSRAIADACGAAIRRRLDGFVGTFSDTSSSPATPVNAWVTFDLETEGAEPEIHGGLSRHTADYIVEYATSGGSY
jgi:hypothetical protein